MADAPDFQQNNHIAIIDIKGNAHIIYQSIVSKNLIQAAIYLAVRHAIEATWINDRDQFYAPNLLWEEDKEFQSDCLAFTLFHGQNKISSQNGTNHFIPFTESEVGAKSAFESDFMTRFMRGKVKLDTSSDSLFGSEGMSEKLEFSPEAKAVFEAGREVFAYYHAQDFSTKPYNVNASLYDIKEFFQGRNAKGVMNPPNKAEDSHYKVLIATLTESLNTLAKKLEPKIYEYGFLRE
ncbi:nucleoside 5-triphosphatase RdgB (dHAPTP, dITP,XTP-specific) [Helicobacter kayseriensis]